MPRDFLKEKECPEEEKFTHEFYFILFLNTEFLVKLIYNLLQNLCIFI